MIIKCGYCKGSGKKYSNATDICPVCSGAGQVDVPSEHYTCGYCKGSGHKYSNASDICPVCNGVGVTRVAKYDT